MARSSVLLLVCGGLLVLPAARGYSSGLVSAACDSMTPSHSGAAPQSTPPPFNVTADGTTYQDGDTITVWLQSTGSAPFLGFLLQAREVGGRTPLGSFGLEGGAARSAQLLTCSGAPNSAVSHTSPVDKKLISATWTVTVSKDPKPIEFRATFVQVYNTFWVNVKSPTLSYSGLLPNATTTAIGTTASSSLTTSMLSISSAGCGVTKVCFSQPPTCNPAEDRSCYFMSAAVSAPPSGPVVHFEMKGPSPGYIAFGFSDDQQMGNDDIYICALDTNGLVQVQHAFSTGKQKPDTLPLGNVSNVMGSLQDGLISCSFSSMNPISTHRGITGFNTPYYLLYAHGPTSNGEILFHTGDFISSDRVNISNPQLVGGAGKPPSIKAHGALMLIAWMTTATLGMMIARYLKSLAKGYSPFGKAVWFLAHVSLMSLTVLASSIAFIVIFSFVRGWSGGTHPVLGCLVMILAFVQPLGALFRCGPDHHLRYVFNLVHMLNAVVIKALAVAAIFTGLQLLDSTESQVLVKIMGGFVGWEAACYLLFELYTRCKAKVLDGDEPKTERVPVALLTGFTVGNLAFLVALLVGIELA